MVLVVVVPEPVCFLNSDDLLSRRAVGASALTANCFPETLNC